MKYKTIDKYANKCGRNNLGNKFHKIKIVE